MNSNSYYRKQPKPPSRSQKGMFGQFLKRKPSSHAAVYGSKKLVSPSRYMDHQSVTNANCSKWQIEKFKSIDSSPSNNYEACNLSVCNPKVEFQRPGFNGQVWKQLLDKTQYSNRLNISQPYSMNRARDDKQSGRTINPNHSYYNSQDYSKTISTTFGSKRASPMPAKAVTSSFQKAKPKVKEERITGCLKKSKEKIQATSFKPAYSSKQLEGDQERRNLGTDLKVSKQYSNYFSNKRPRELDPFTKGGSLIGTNPKNMILDKSLHPSNSSISTSKQIKYQRDYGSRIAGLSGSKVGSEVSSPRNGTTRADFQSRESLLSRPKTQFMLTSTEQERLGLQYRVGCTFNERKLSTKNLSHLSSSFDGFDFSTSKNAPTTTKAANSGTSCFQDITNSRNTSTSRTRAEGSLKNKVDAFRSQITTLA